MGTKGGRGFEVEVRAPGIALVTFNRPERLNSMTQSLKRDLVETMQQAQLDDAVRVVVFTGTGERSARATTWPAGTRRTASRRKCQLWWGITGRRLVPTTRCG